MQITSNAFGHNGYIPIEYTCQGSGVNPPLQFSDIPKTCVSLALIVSDPDAVGKTPFYHWVIFNIDPATKTIPSNSYPHGAILGKNDFGENGYGPPCPPEGSGTHRYVFSLFALDRKLDLEVNPSAEVILDKIKGHVLETAEIIGLYSKN